MKLYTANHIPNIVSKIRGFLCGIRYTKYGIRNRGAVSLMTILILAFILVEITAVGLITAFLSGEQGLGLKASHVATYAARSGIQDVLLRISRDKTFVPDPNPYTISVAEGSVSVQITRTLPDATHVLYTIASTGSAGPKRVKITGTVLIDDENGSISNIGVVESGI